MPSLRTGPYRQRDRDTENLHDPSVYLCRPNRYKSLSPIPPGNVATPAGPPASTSVRVRASETFWSHLPTPFPPSPWHVATHRERRRTLYHAPTPRCPALARRAWTVFQGGFNTPSTAHAQPVQMTLHPTRGESSAARRPMGWHGGAGRVEMGRSTRAEL